MFLCIPTRLVIENSKKIAKKFKKSENTIIASFRTKLGWEKLRKRENKKKSFPCVSTQPVIENSKIIVKEFKKLQNSIIASFQDKIGWERPRKGENKKNKKSFQCAPTRPVIENSKKNCKKIQEITKLHQSFVSSQNRLGKA